MTLSMSRLAGKTVVLGVTGGIAAYKAAELCRLLVKDGARVRVVMTPAATEFVGALTFQTLSGAPVGLALLDSDAEARIGHIQLGDQADVIVVAPASADAIARMAAGMADDLLTAVVLASRAPVLLAPAMNVNMWQNPLTQQNLGRLVGTGRFFTVGPDSGELACGWVGAGRLIEPPEIAERALRLLRPQDLVGRRVVVTAGPTIEPIDDVRFIGNRSSGKMGFALAAAAVSRGAEVTLIAGPVALPRPVGTALGGPGAGGHPLVRRDVETTEQMRLALQEAVPGSDVVIMAAAVSDFRPAARAPGKLSRRGRGASPGASSGSSPSPFGAAPPAGGPSSSVELVANPDLLAELGRTRRGGRPMLVGFAAEAGGTPEAMVARAREKLVEKGCDLVVANDITAAGIGFGSDENAVTLVYAKSLGPVAAAPGGPAAVGPAAVGIDRSTETLPRAPKLEIAHAILDRLAARLPPRDTAAVPVRRASRSRTGAPPARPPTFGPASVHGRRRRG